MTLATQKTHKVTKVLPPSLGLGSPSPQRGTHSLPSEQSSSKEMCIIHTMYVQYIYQKQSKCENLCSTQCAVQMWNLVFGFIIKQCHQHYNYQHQNYNHHHQNLRGADVKLALRAGFCWVWKTLLRNQTSEHWSLISMIIMINIIFIFFKPIIINIMKKKNVELSWISSSSRGAHTPQ